MQASYSTRDYAIVLGRDRSVGWFGDLGWVFGDLGTCFMPYTPYPADCIGIGLGYRRFLSAGSLLIDHRARCL